MSHLENSQTKTAALSVYHGDRGLLFFLIAPRHQVNIDIGGKTQQTIDDRAAQQFFPMATGRLSQHNLCHALFTRDLSQGFSKIAAFGTNDLGSQVFSECGMLFQTPTSLLSVSFRVTPIFEPADQFAGESEIALRLDRNSNQIGVQPMRQPPGITNDLPG